MKPPSTLVVDVLTDWPNQEWLTEDELAAQLSPGYGITAGPGGLMVKDRTLVSVLNEARRRSWLIRDRRSGECRWQRTPTGAGAVQ